MSSDNRSIIPAEEMEEAFDAWSPPVIEEGSIVEAFSKSHQRDHGATVEDVDLSEEAIEVSPISAEELERITNDAHQEGYQAGHQQGHQQGLQQGQQEGYQAGLARANEELAVQVAQLQQVMAAFASPIAGREAHIEELMLQLLRETTEAVLLRELQQPEQTLLAVIQQAIAVLPMSASDVRIFLNPQDKQLIETHLVAQPEWQLLDDPAVAAGGCRVETPQSVVDNTLQTRLAQVFEQMELRQHQPVDSGADNSGTDDSGSDNDSAVDATQSVGNNNTPDPL